MFLSLSYIKVTAWYLCLKPFSKLRPGSTCFTYGYARRSAFLKYFFFFRNPQSCVNFNIFSNFVCWFDEIFNIRYHVHQVLLPVYVYFANCPFIFVSILKKLEQLQRKLLPLKFPKRLFDADLFIVNHDSLYCGRSLTFSFKWLKAWDIFHILFIPMTFFQNIST